VAEPPYIDIRDDLVAGMVVPFLGAGASLSQATADDVARIPSAAELSLDLADRAPFPSDDPRDRSDLAKVASYYVEVSGRGRLRRRLHSLLVVNARPGALHEYLASLPGHRLIITTNYDTLLEQALTAAGKPFHLVVHPMERDEWRGSVLWWQPGAERPETLATNMLDIDLGVSTVVYKMHGTVSASGEWDNFVITEDDYTDFLSQMSGGNSAMPAIFQAQLRERNLLFLGYSLSDWNLRVILKSLRQQRQAEGRGEDFRSWAIQRKPSEFERTLWERRGVEIYDQNIDELVARLRALG